MSLRILVVDDDKKIVRLLHSYLTQEGMTVFTAHTGEEALALIRRERPDCVILDLMLPERDGWEVTKAVRRDPALAALPILMLTARVEDTDKILGLELGADDYVAKPFNPREVVARVRAILRRTQGTPQPTTILQQGELRLDADRHFVTLAGDPLDLTPTEFSLLHTLMSAPGHAFTRGELIEKALGYRYDGMDRSLDSHIKNLRKKIEPDLANPLYVETVFGVGYRFRQQKAGGR
jgi:two-component system alkaline phosphatase synthesis response regulator PhoP